MCHWDWPSGLQRDPAPLVAQHEKMHHIIFRKDLGENTMTVIRQGGSNLHIEGIANN